MKEQIAKNLYRISAAGRYGADFPKWETLLPDQQDFFRNKADTLVLSLIREEMRGSLLTKEERDIVNEDCFETMDEERIAYCQAQLDKILKVLEV